MRYCYCCWVLAGFRNSKYIIHLTVPLPAELNPHPLAGTVDFCIPSLPLRYCDLFELNKKTSTKVKVKVKAKAKAATAAAAAALSLALT